MTPVLRYSEEPDPNLDKRSVISAPMDFNPASFKQLAFADLDRELNFTRSVLERLPDEHYAWKPHEKSMSLAQLASHVADLPGWMKAAIAHDELDTATSPAPPASAKDQIELLARFDQNVIALKKAIESFEIANLDHAWSMRNGEDVVVTRPRTTVYRIWCLNHLIHHRAQLCLYLRLLNLPVPTVYFNTADDPNWVFD